LSKFDSGKRLTNKEFSNVNMWLRKNVAPNITLLERSLYLDPASGLRLSRLGIQTRKTATLRDVLRGNFTLWQKQGKPQILVFENAKIAKFPKALRIVEKKLKAGQKLTETELNKLIRWQVQTGSGKFKPIGSTIYAGGRELEITLAPRELIRRVKSLGRVYVEGRRVSIVSAEVFKPPRNILRQMRLANLGKLTRQQLSNLENYLSKQLGRRIQVETPRLAASAAKGAARLARRMNPNIPVLRVSGLGIRVLSRGFRQIRQVRNIGRATRRLSRPTRFSGRVVRRNGRIIRRNLRGPVARGRVNPRIVRGGRMRPRVNGRFVKQIRRNLRP
jgi:hypothetical protein